MSIPEKSNHVELDLIQDASDETVGYQPKGYSFLGEYFLVCPSCDKKLVSLVLVKKLENNPPKEEIYRAKCLKCGVKSFQKKVVNHKLIGQAVPPLSIVDVETIDNTTEFMVK